MKRPKPKKDPRLKTYLRYCPCGNDADEVNCLTGRCERCRKIEEALYPQRKSIALTK